MIHKEKHGMMNALIKPTITLMAAASTETILYPIDSIKTWSQTTKRKPWVTNSLQHYNYVLKQAYQSAPNEIINTALANYPNVTDKDIAQAAFASYRVKQGFQSMLLMKASGGGISTIHFSELDKGIDNLSVKSNAALPNNLIKSFLL